MRRVLAVLLLAGATAGCLAEPEPGAQRRPRTSPPRAADAPEAPAQAALPTEPEPVPVEVPAPVARDPFAGAGDAALPATDSTEHHLDTSNAGKDCMSCHAPGNGAPTFVLAGTVQATKADPTGATGVEVRVVGPGDEEIAHVRTDSAGNFWLAGTLPLPPGSNVGIRSGAAARTMSGTIGTGACNQAGCHAKTQPIFLAN